MRNAKGVDRHVAFGALAKVLPRDGAGVISIGLLVMLTAAWELSSKVGLVPRFILPAPSDVAGALMADLSSKSIAVDFLYTLTEVLVGFGMSVLLGVGLGALMALYPLVDRVLSPYIVALQTIPKIAIAPILIIWFGFGMSSKIVIVALLAFFPILINAAAGFRNVDARQIVLMNAFGASEWQIFVKVRFPSAIPYLMASFYISMVLSVIGAVVGEFLGSAQGLGSQIVQRQGNMDVTGVFSILVILTLMGATLNAITRMIGQRMSFWTNTESRSGL